MARSARGRIVDFARCRTSLVLLVLALGGGPGLGGCQQEGANRGGTRQESNRIFQVRGVVKGIEGTTALIRHEEIPGFMAAMTMPFAVRDTNELQRVHAGDLVRFRLTVGKEESWIDQISPVRDRPMEMPSRQSVQQKSFDPIVEGELLPDFVFTNEMGQAVHLSGYRGEPMAFTFIFTRCPMPDFCPRMSSHFAEVQKRLKDSGLARWRLLSISFDPEFDTPMVLKSYGRLYQADFAHWSFLTGELGEIGGLAAQLGLAFEKEGGTFNHKLRTVVVDPSGRVKKIFLGNTWTPEDLVREMVAAGKP